MAKSKSRMVTRDTLYPSIDKFLDEEVKMKFLLLCPVMYLFSVVHDNRCYPEVVKKIIF